VLSEGWYKWEGKRSKESVWKVEYGGNIMYSFKKMEK
jgi:hypothetical protein